MKNFLIASILLLSGCCAYPGEAYVEADAVTYEYAQPKLVEWAEMKAKAGDEEWRKIVKNKGLSWKARVDRARAKGKKDPK